MTAGPSIQFGSAAVPLTPSSIRREWVLEGQPVARKGILSTSADGTATMLVWDCTAGRFNWFYTLDESVYILEGSVVLKDTEGNSRLVKQGDTVFFPAGSRAEWSVETYVRKLAFMRSTVPAPMVLAIRVFRRMKRMILRSRDEGAPMFG